MTLKNLNEYIKTHDPPYKIALAVFVLGLPLNMYITFISAAFIGTGYTNYTFIPTLIDIYSSGGLTENFIIVLFDVFGMWARCAIISLMIITLWYGTKHFLNRNKISRINFSDCVAFLSFVGAGFGFKMLMLFPWLP